MGVALPHEHEHATPFKAHGLMAGLKSAAARGLTAALLALVPASFAGVSQAAAETRSLKVYFVHTGERAEVVFKRNGKYDPKGLQTLNRLLRDWRRNEPTRMDPRLWDLVWSVYRSTGAKDYIHAVSGYRSPNTNEMLRSRSKGVAKNSQHRLGKAMDFYIPGVPLKTLRETAMRFQGGGVGYYPTSGSPFVHLDVGSVRAWPRMSRQELVRLFPNGKTLHIPADGTPLPGYQQALAEYKNGQSSASYAVASASGGATKKRGFLTALFGGGDEDEDGEAITRPAPAARPAVAKTAPARPQAPATTAPAEIRNLPGSEVLVASAPVPPQRPAFAGQVPGNGLATALYSPQRSTAQEALAAVMPAERPQAQDNANGAYPDLAGMAVPVPTLLGQRGGAADTAAIMTASIAPAGPDLIAIPVPAARPAVAEALLAQSEAAVEAQEDAAEQDVLSSDMIAALNTSGADARRQHLAVAQPPVAAAMAAPVAAAAPVPVAAPASVRPIERAKGQVAAAQPAAAAAAGTFGDVFDAPKPAPRGIEAGLPAKGGRPAEAEAEKARRAMTAGASELTGETLAKWAFARQRQPSPSGSLKAQRVTASAIVADVERYNANTRPQQLQADSERFSGNARVLTGSVR